MTTFKIGGTYMNAPPFIMMETFWRKYFCVSIFLCYFADERNLELKWKNQRELTLRANFQVTRENFPILTRLSVLAGGSFLFWFT